MRGYADFGGTGSSSHFLFELVLHQSLLCFDVAGSSSWFLTPLAPSFLAGQGRPTPVTEEVAPDIASETVRTESITAPINDRFVNLVRVVGLSLSLPEPDTSRAGWEDEKNLVTCGGRNGREVGASRFIQLAGFWWIVLDSGGTG